MALLVCPHSLSLETGSFLIRCNTLSHRKRWFAHAIQQRPHPCVCPVSYLQKSRRESALCRAPLITLHQVRWALLSRP
eukprot:1159239-Pelagomonas_calceolata.AAC.14